MHVVLVSNCEQRAVTRTRALLDRYLPRIGDRTWGGRITQAALDEMHTAMRRIATRQTSVACYRNDATLGLRLEWVVGNRSSYDSYGRFSIATQTRKKRFPMILRHAALVATMSGYIHDFGKASKFFQKKLKNSIENGLQDQRDPIRHEWLSAWLFRYILDSGLLENGEESFLEAWKECETREGKGKGNDPRSAIPVQHQLSSPFHAVLWSACTHHGAIGGSLTNSEQLIGNSEHVRPDIGIESSLNITFQGFDQQAKQDYRRWRTLFHEINRLKKRLQETEKSGEYWEIVFLIARAALILADHKVSSGTFDGERENDILYANTKKCPDKEEKPSLRRPKNIPKKSKHIVRFLDQPLSWHLLEIGKQAGQNIRMFSGEDLPAVSPDLVHEVLKDRAESGSRFAWQDEAVDALKGLSVGGKLIFNVASTGAGKTLANLKMGFALRPEKTRLAVALNLRSLTRQTFLSYKKHLRDTYEDVFKREFACLMGELASRSIEFLQEDEDDILTEDDIYIEGEPSAPDWLKDIAGGSNKKLVKLIASPVLISTMDWIVASGEPGKQDRHAKALIRVANSDLILDEVDSYDLQATVAVMRVVRTAAMFGRNVIVSSATLNPVLAKGLIAAYSTGRKIHETVSGRQDWDLVLVSDGFPPAILASPTTEDGDNFYRKTMQTMAEQLQGKPVTKRYRVVSVERESTFPETIVEQALALHDRFAVVPQGLSCKLSIGLVRMANISPCRKVAEILLSDGRFFVTCYHSEDILERRDLREGWMDRILSRGDGKWVEALKTICPWIENKTGDVRLVVVATPVEEVGRDHDFDWAIIEPSSTHSIIQTAGRVNRHRRNPLPIDSENIVLLSKNRRELEGKKRVFVYPGLEKPDNEGESTHPKHDLREIFQSCENRLDVSLVFDPARKTPFAQYDENSIYSQLAEIINILERKKGFEMGFMIKDYVDDYPLRANTGLRQEIYDLDLENRKFKKGNINCGDLFVEDNESNCVWLTPTIENLIDKYRELHCAVRVSGDKTIDKLTIVWNGIVKKL